MSFTLSRLAGQRIAQLREAIAKDGEAIVAAFNKGRITEPQMKAQLAALHHSYKPTLDTYRHVLMNSEHTALSSLTP